MMGSRGPILPCNLLAFAESVACLAYCSLFLLCFVDTGAMLNTASQNSVTAHITASALMWYVTAILIYCIVFWVLVFVMVVGYGMEGLKTRHFRPMATHLLCFVVFIIVLEMFCIIFYYQVQGYQSDFEDRYVGDTLTPLLDVRIYVQWQIVKLFIVAFAPLEAKLLSYSIVRHRNPQENALLPLSVQGRTPAASYASTDIV